MRLMPIFAVEVEGSVPDRILANAFLEKVDKHLQTDNVFKNPFVKSHVVRIATNRYVIVQNPGYVNIAPYGFLLMFGCWLIWGFNWGLFPGAIIALTGLVFTKQYFYLNFWLGLRKLGFRGKTKLLSTNDLLRLTYGPAGSI